MSGIKWLNLQKDKCRFFLFWELHFAFLRVPIFLAYSLLFAILRVPLFLAYSLLCTLSVDNCLGKPSFTSLLPSAVAMRSRAERLIVTTV